MEQARLRLGLALVLLLVSSATGCGEDGAPSPPESLAPLPRAGPEHRWPAWGGPRGDFHLPDAGLAESWPADGPPLLWSRTLGHGYSAMVYDRGLLCTLYRDGSDDVVVAMRADDGRTVWTYRYPARTHPQNELQYGSGPNATPLIFEDRLVTLSYGGKLHCLELFHGRLLWTVDLIADLDGAVLPCGNSASPIAEGGRVIVLVGGTRQAVVALDPVDGSVAWRSGPGSVSYATPIVITASGRRQIVYASEDAVVGIDAETGERLWDYPSFNSNRDNISNPIWGADGLLWSSTQPEGGSRVIRLDRVEERIVPRRVWSSHRIHIHYWNAIRVGEHVYASIGGQGSVFAGIDVRTGAIAWRRRGFEKANLIQAGEKTLLLDADGTLAMLSLSPEAPTVVSRHELNEPETWTVPTLVGTTLYVRDHTRVRAYDLARQGS